MYNFALFADIRFINWIQKRLKETCVICKDFILASEEFSVIIGKGINNINKSSIEKCDYLMIEAEANAQKAICERLSVN